MINTPVIEDTISAATARCLYNQLARVYDWAERFEGRAKDRALATLALAPRQRVLNVGVGTGHEQAQLQTRVTPGGASFGLDISPVMRAITHARTAAWLCGGDARELPLWTAASMVSSRVTRSISSRTGTCRSCWPTSTMCSGQAAAWRWSV